MLKAASICISSLHGISVRVKLGIFAGSDRG